MIDGGRRHAVRRVVSDGLLVVLRPEHNGIIPLDPVRMLWEQLAQHGKRQNRFVLMASVIIVHDQLFGRIPVEKARKRDVPVRNLLLLAVHYNLRERDCHIFKIRISVHLIDVQRRPHRAGIHHDAVRNTGRIAPLEKTFAFAVAVGAAPVLFRAGKRIVRVVRISLI